MKVAMETIKPQKFDTGALFLLKNKLLSNLLVFHGMFTQERQCTQSSVHSGSSSALQKIKVTKYLVILVKAVSS